MKNNQVKKTILIAPEYAMADLAESHRMASIAKAFLEEENKVFILGEITNIKSRSVPIKWQKKILEGVNKIDESEIESLLKD